jgi:hypothetical protein
VSAESEAARVVWADAVAKAGDAAELLQKAYESDATQFDIEARTFDLEDAQARSDETYAAYLETMTNWVTEAPRRGDYIMASATATLEDGTVLPSVIFGFRGGTEAPITVSFVTTEIGLRKFQKELDKAISEAVRTIRKMAT